MDPEGLTVFLTFADNSQSLCAPSKTLAGPLRALAAGDTWEQATEQASDDGIDNSLGVLGTATLSSSTDAGQSPPEMTSWYCFAVSVYALREDSKD